jgi:hypothetical protein
MNYQINFDPAGGDLGRAEIRPISPLEFHVILPHVAHILECLHVAGHSRLPFRYAFEFPLHTKDMILMETMSASLPPHVAFYECDGQKLFELRGQSGGVVSGLVCYLITHD